MKLILPAGFLLAGFAAFTILKRTNPKIENYSATGAAPVKDIVSDEAEKWKSRLRNRSEILKPYLAARGFNTDYCFLVDMKIASGKKRFFVYSVSGDSVVTAGLVTHGSGSQTATGNLQFSNVPNSYASSLGKYQVANAYSGKFGLAYKLIGLEKSNSNAFVRAVVLHAHPLIPAQETYPENICTSWGCPTVNPDYLKVLAGYIDHSAKPILLQIFY